MNKERIEPLISVIIPVYNVEDYIHRCINSVLNQTYKNLEIILVDDGALDRSGDICDEYSEQDQRIIVVHKENGGLSSARNAGLDIARGKFISFVDSDDWIAKDTMQYCINLINSEEEMVDVVQYGVALVSSESEQISNKGDTITRFKGKDILNHLMVMSTRTDSYFSVCRCLFAAHLLKDEKFPEGRINEDIAYKYKVLSKANYMIDSNAIKYFYYQSTGSITTEGFKKKDLDLFIAAEELKNLTANESYGSIRKLGEVKYARTSLSLLCKIAYFGIKDSSVDKQTTVKELQKKLRSDFLILINSPIPLSRKCCACLLVINIKLLEVPVKVYKLVRKKT